VCVSLSLLKRECSLVSRPCVGLIIIIIRILFERRKNLIYEFFNLFQSLVISHITFFVVPPVQLILIETPPPGT